MPVLTFEGPELENAVRKELIEALTETAARIVPNIPKSAYYVYLREYPPERVGVAGLVLPEYLATLEGNE
jgi:phenylpyruvate tautomerase PptA (4-oxalocrotonate tautomerase family)